jgi:hypothetical protein
MVGQSSHPTRGGFRRILDIFARPALAEFPDDVAAAAKLASDSVSRMKAPTDPRAEPWPPMRARTGL